MFIIEGNIGAGKSTFLKLIQKYIQEAKIALEPIENWHNNIQGQSLLENFYKDPKRWAYTLETVTMISRLKGHRQSESPLTIIERSIYSGHYCFAYNDYLSGFLSDFEWQIYLELFDLVTKNCKNPDGFIYLKVDPNIAYKRINKRSRIGETIPLEYLQQINDRHEEFLIKKQNVNEQIKNVPVLTIDCNEEFEEDVKLQNKIFHDVKNFILDLI
ncbi:deoxynucleoside kinase [Candidatus Dependentiae bacterium]|nr:deoxynucleoside kinase [Candidatus Dependentiae bacterium]